MTYKVYEYPLVDGSWFLFVEVNDSTQNWEKFSQDLRQSFEKGEVKGIGGAIKTKGESKVLPPWPEDLPDEVWSIENGLLFRLETRNVLNPGLFLDQKENRKRLKTILHQKNQATVLNLFSFTGAFSIVAASCGAKATSVDLSKRYLKWERKNHEKNKTINLAKLICSDARRYLKRCQKKGRKFDVIIIDPPTFSRSKEGIFQVEMDLVPLCGIAMDCLQPGGFLLASTNAQDWPSFYEEIRGEPYECGHMRSVWVSETGQNR